MKLLINDSAKILSGSCQCPASCLAPGAEEQQVTDTGLNM